MRLQGWHIGVIEEGEASVRKERLEQRDRQLILKPQAERTPEDQKKIDAELMSFFRRNVRPKLAERIPAIKKSDDAAAKVTEFSGEQVRAS